MPGLIAATLLGIAMIREHEHSWLLWLALAGTVYGVGGWLIFVAMILGASL